MRWTEFARTWCRKSGESSGVIRRAGRMRLTRPGPFNSGLRRGVHGFRGSAAGEFLSVKQALGFTEVEAWHELAMWLGHNPHRTEVTYAYVPRNG